MNHIMLDLETLGVKESAVFTSIAAVQFDPKTGEIGRKFKVNVDIQSALDYGRKVEGKTLEWWLKQRPEITAKMFEDPQTLSFALENLSMWVDNLGYGNAVTLWGNSASFDIGKLRNAYEHLDMNVPWSHRNEMCYRTVKNMFPDVPHDETDEARAHDPIYDCEKQVKRLAAIYKAAFHSIYQDTEFEDGYTQAILLLSNIQVEGKSSLVPTIKNFMANNNYHKIVATQSAEYKTALGLLERILVSKNPALARLQKDTMAFLQEYANKPVYRFEKPFEENDTRLNTSTNSAHSHTEGSDL